MRYEETQEFKRDFKKLQKRFSSLTEDLKTNKQYRLELFHCKGIDSKSIVVISNASNTEELKFFKVRKFQCKSLKGRGARSGIRIIYAYFPNEQRIVFLEIYFKTDKENESKKKISGFIKNNTKP